MRIDNASEYLIMAVRRNGCCFFLELGIIILIILGEIFFIQISIFLILYILLSIMGSWIIPFFTSYLVHTPEGSNELLQTRLFRGNFTL